MDLALHVLIAGFLLRVGWSDWERRRIPNGDVAIIALAAALVAMLSPLAPSTLAGSYAAALLLTLPGYALGRVGGGDVKLLCALAPLWSGRELLAIFAGGVAMVCATLLACSSYRRALAGAGRSAADNLPDGLPLGTAVMWGALFWLLARLAHG